MYFLCWACWVFVCWCRGFGHHDDDFIFEDFARLRLTGHAADDTEAWWNSAIAMLLFFFVTDGRYTDSTWCTAGLCSHLLTSWPRAFWQMFLFCVTCLCICNRACVRESCQPVDTPQQWFSVVAMFVCSCFGVVIECRCCPCCSLLLPQTTLPVVGWSL